MGKYDRVRPEQRKMIARLYRVGLSMANIGRRMQISESEVRNVLIEENNAGNPVFLCNRLSKNLSKKDLRVIDYLHFIRAKNFTHRNGIPTVNILANIKKVTDLCFTKNIDLAAFANSFSELRKFVLSAPREISDTVFLAQLELFEKQIQKMDDKIKTIPWLKKDIERLERLLGIGSSESADL